MRISDWSSDVCSSDLAKGRPEDRFENVADVAEISMAAAIRSAAHAVLAETVIEGALLRIAQAVIGLADRLEARLAVAAPRILVGVIFHRPLAIARFERRIVGGAFAFEQFVIVDVERHDAPNLRPEEHTSELQSLMRISYAVF